MKNTEAQKARKRAYYAAHREEELAKKAIYAATHKDVLRSRRAVYRAAHLEEERARFAVYYQEHKDELLAKNAARYAKWYVLNKSKKQEYARAHPEISRLALKKTRSIYPEKHAARKKVHVAIRLGRLPSARTLTCSCGEPASEYHHPSYEPEHQLDVIAVCKKCHLNMHKEARIEKITS